MPAMYPQRVGPIMEEEASRPKTQQQLPGNLPVVPTSFVGRQLEIAALTQRLRHPHARLLTLTGPGGTGKTRLALEVASDLQPEFAAGAFIVDLAPLDDPQLVPSAMAAALGVREAAGQPVLDRVREHLKDKRLLLVVDNFEHLLAASPVIGQLIATCPELKVLATSRTPLGLYGEHEFPVQPLPVPDLQRAHDPAELAQVEAVQLFVARAQATRPDFLLTEDNAPLVAEICVRLDGLPLALELAAARIRLLQPTVLLGRLQHTLALLTGGARDLPPRQQTLRATIDWSYELLDPTEQRLFRQLGVFSGGWTLEAAEAVCELGSADGSSVDMLDALEALGRASLVRQSSVSDEARFEMLGTVREYAAQRLEDSGEAELARARHAAQFMSLCETAEPLLHGPRQRYWLDRLERELANLRAALDWSLRGGAPEAGLRLAAALWWFWVIRASLYEGQRWMDSAVAATGPAPTATRAKVLYCAGLVSSFQGDWDRSRRRCEAALELCRQFGDSRGAAYACFGLGMAAFLEGDASAARAHIEEGVRLFRGGPILDAWGLRNVLNALGEIERSQGDFGRAQALYEESLALARQEADAHGIGLLLYNLALVALHHADASRAADLLSQAVHVWRDLGYRSGLAVCILTMGSLASIRQQPERAMRLFGAADSLMEQVGRRVRDSAYQEYFAATQTGLDRRAFDEAFQAGRQMTMEQALAEGLASAEPEPLPGAPPPRSPGAGYEPLTIREWEVAQLVARGLTNRQIASELVVTEGTAAKHVENIRAKLELTSRTQVAAWVLART